MGWELLKRAVALGFMKVAPLFLSDVFSWLLSAPNAMARLTVVFREPLRGEVGLLWDSWRKVGRGRTRKDPLVMGTMTMWNRLYGLYNVHTAHASPLSNLILSKSSKIGFCRVCNDLTKRWLHVWPPSCIVSGLPLGENRFKTDSYPTNSFHVTCYGNNNFTNL